MLKLLDFFFIGFHTVLIVFNLFGWIFPKTRRLNLIVLILTGASWFILGIFYGIGYCPLTDWHFRILENLGTTNLPDSYVTYLIQRLTGYTFDQSLVDLLTLICFFVALGVSIGVNIYFSRRPARRSCSGGGVRRNRR